MKKIVFLGGIHGVGKTHLCSELCKEINISYFSASQLIRKQKEEMISRTKNVIDIKGNQDALIMAIRNYVPNNSSILLDGHFCILNLRGEIERIPQITFEQLDLSCLIVLIDQPKIIQERLKWRDKVDYSIEMLDQFQSEEISYAKQLAISLNLPLLVHQNGEEPNELNEFIKSNT